MSESDPLGRLALLVIVLVVFYDTIFGLVRVSAETITSAVESFISLFDNLIVLFGGGNAVFPNTEELLLSIFSWEAFIFTNAMALALVFFIDVVMSAFRA